MASSITLQKVRELQDKAQSAFARARNAKTEASKRIEKATETVVQSLEVGGTAFGFGLVTGRYGGVEILGIAGDLGAALALHAAALIVDDDAAGKHLHNFGDGAIAAYLHQFGLGVGTKWAQDSAAASQAAALPAPSR